MCPKPISSSGDVAKRKPDWTIISLVVTNILFVAVLLFVLAYIPLAYGPNLTARDSFTWSVYALLLGLLANYHLSKAASRREVLRETQATARGALRRILQAKSGVKAIVRDLDYKIAEAQATLGSKKLRPIDPVYYERQIGLRDRVVAVLDVLVYAEYDWKEILSEDIQKQHEEEEEYAMAQDKVAELTVGLNQALEELNNASQELSKERDVSAEAQSEKDGLEKQIASDRRRIAKLTDELNEARNRVATAERQAPFPLSSALGVSGTIGSALASTFPSLTRPVSVNLETPGIDYSGLLDPDSLGAGVKGYPFTQGSSPMSTGSKDKPSPK